MTLLNSIAEKTATYFIPMTEYQVLLLDTLQVELLEIAIWRKNRSWSGQGRIMYDGWRILRFTLDGIIED
jgi:hypothetical protein